MRGPGGNDDMEGCGFRKNASGLLLYKSIGYLPTCVLNCTTFYGLYSGLCF